MTKIKFFYELFTNKKKKESKWCSRTWRYFFYDEFWFNGCGDAHCNEIERGKFKSDGKARGIQSIALLSKCLLRRPRQQVSLRCHGPVVPCDGSYDKSPSSSKSSSPSRAFDTSGSWLCKSHIIKLLSIDHQLNDTTPKHSSTIILIQWIDIDLKLNEFVACFIIRFNAWKQCCCCRRRRLSNT